MRNWPKLRLSRPAVVALLVWSVLLWLDRALPQFADRVVTTLETTTGNLVLAGVLLAAVLVLLFAGTILRLIGGWANRTRWSEVDTSAALICIGAAIAGFATWRYENLNGLRGIPWVLCGLLAILALRALRIVRRPAQEVPDAESGPIYDRILGSRNLWSYREPERLVRVYFDSLAVALARQAPHIESQRILRRIASGLADIGTGRIAGVSRVIFGGFGGGDTRRNEETTFTCAR